MRKPRDQQYNGGLETRVWAYGGLEDNEKVIGLQITAREGYLVTRLTADAARRLARKLEQFTLWKMKQEH